MDKNIDIKQELKRSKEYVTQQRELIEHIKHNVNLNIIKMNQRWIEIRTMQNVTVPETDSREEQNERNYNLFTVKKKLYRILKEMEKVWDMTEGTDRQKELPESFRMKSLEADSQRQRKDVAGNTDEGKYAEAKRRHRQQVGTGQM